MLRAIRIALLLVGMSATSLMTARDAEAQATAIVNGSFETPPTPWMVRGRPDGLFEAIEIFYGFTPSAAGWTPNFVVFPPFYTDILNGGPQLAGVLAALPGGPLNVVTHSHGGNAAIQATYFLPRSLRTLVNLATPINWDMTGLLGGASTNSWRCQISSSADWVQFVGSSPTQILNFAFAIYASIAGAVAAFEALAAGDYWTALAYFQLSVFEVMVAEYWWYSTKVEVVGPTYMFSGLGHSDMHSGPVWNAIAPQCG